MTWRTCPACARPLMPGEVCEGCPEGRVTPQLEWPADIRAEFSRQPVAAVGQVSVEPEKFPALVWDLVWLSGQDPWANAATEGGDSFSALAFFGKFEGRPFVVHDIRGRGPTLYVVGAPDLSGQAVLDAVFASLARRPWFGHAEPGLVM